MDAYSPHIALAVVAALVAYGLTWVARGWVPPGRRRDAVLRSVSVGVGLVAGWSLGLTSEAVDGWGWALGVGGGALATAIVAAAKRRIARAVDEGEGHGLGR